MPTNVLFIDDDASFKRLLELRLKSFMPDMVVTNFDNLTAVRKFLSQDNRPLFDLVVLDEHLPDGRGVELMQEGWFADLAVLSVSSDDAPEIPGASVSAGAKFFLNKSRISEPLFKPLVQGIIDRNKLQRELDQTKLDSAVIDTVKTLVGTLRHEINNPLGAVLGAAYILQRANASHPEQVEAATLIESSGQRIKHVLDELCKAIELEPIQKAHQKVFHIPGDAPWESGKKPKE